MSVEITSKHESKVQSPDQCQLHVGIWNNVYVHVHVCRNDLAKTVSSLNMNLLNEHAPTWLCVRKYMYMKLHTCTYMYLYI